MRNVRDLVGHGIAFDWVSGPMKSRDTVYPSPTGGSLKNLAASGMCLNPKDPGSKLIRSITVSYVFTWPSEKKTNVKTESLNLYWVRHHSSVDIIRRKRVTSLTVNCEQCHQTSDQGHPDDHPHDSARIRVPVGRRNQPTASGRLWRNCLGGSRVAGRARDIASRACQ